MKTKFFLLLVVPLLLVSSLFADVMLQEYPNGNSINDYRRFRVIISGALPKAVWYAGTNVTVRTNNSLLRTVCFQTVSKTVFADRDNNVWVGTLRRAFRKYDGSPRLPIIQWRAEKLTG